MDAVHASPPCQAYSPLAALHPGVDYPDLIEDTRAMLQTSGLPSVIENVSGAPLDRASTLFGSHGVLLCGSMFGLGASGRQSTTASGIRDDVSTSASRHVVIGARPSSWLVTAAAVRTVAVTRARTRSTATPMGIDWATKAEIAQAIPPAYTQFIGEQLLAVLPIERR